MSDRPRRARDGEGVDIRAWGGSWGGGGDIEDVVVVPLIPARCEAMASAREGRKRDLTLWVVWTLARRARCQNVAGDDGGKEGRATVK